MSLEQRIKEALNLLTPQISTEGTTSHLYIEGKEEVAKAISELVEEENKALQKKASTFGDDQQSGRTMEYWQGYGSGCRTGYYSGAYSVLSTSSPSEIVEKMAEALKGLISRSSFGNETTWRIDKDAIAKCDEALQQYNNLKLGTHE